MDITLIATAAMTLIGPYVTKAAETVAEKAGEHIWSKVKNVFVRDKEKGLIEKADEGKIDRRDLVEIEDALIEHLKDDGNFLQTIKESLNIVPANEFILENNLKVAANLREELKPLYLEQIDAGIANEGDYNNKISLQERKLKKIDKKIIELITNKE